jgi:hypothetical protein
MGHKGEDVEEGDKGGGLAGCNVACEMLEF